MPGLPELTRRRIAAGLSREAFGALIQPPVTGKTIYNWERGIRRPNTDDLQRLADALGCTRSDLVAETELPAAAGGAA